MSGLVLLLLVAVTLAQEIPPPEFCNIWGGYPSFEPQPPTEENTAWEIPSDWWLFNWVSPWEEGLFPAPLQTLQDLICDMSNTLLWKADVDVLYVLSPKSGRTKLAPYSYGSNAFGEFQLMETKCMFNQYGGVYFQTLNDELTGMPIWIQRWSFMALDEESTWVLSEAWYPSWTADAFCEWFDVSYITAGVMWDTDLEVEMSRLYTLATEPECPAVDA